MENTEDVSETVGKQFNPVNEASNCDFKDEDYKNVKLDMNEEVRKYCMQKMWYMIPQEFIEAVNFIEKSRTKGPKSAKQWCKVAPCPAPDLDPYVVKLHRLQFVHKQTLLKAWYKCKDCAVTKVIKNVESGMMLERNSRSYNLRRKAMRMKSVE